MDRFVSHYTLRLDAKGRVSIPAPFRAVLARDGFEGLYCYPTLDRPALDAGGTLWHQRSAEDRWRGEGDPHRAAEESCRHQGGDRLCRPRSQVSDLGAW